LFATFFIAHKGTFIGAATTAFQSLAGILISLFLFQDKTLNAT
jgi:hypothetical protein